MEKPTSKPDRDDHTTVTNATCDQSAAYDRSPYVVFYELTRACDLVCLHCRACAQSNPDPRELNTDQSCALIDQIAEFPRPPILVFTGGDPFKRADVVELIRHAVSRGLETAITPSATPLVTREAVVRLRDAGVTEDRLPEIARTAINDGCLMYNPDDVTYAEALEILKKAF